ncbi:MAG TPA: metallophosphoesterase [Candidatus Bathyarchaeia archaeon]|nr:metallophosphoesterase [Candidatus Bathyarchaeia archaeon]
MLIAHISDIHYGPQFQKKYFETAVEEINALAPDALIITGDLTENGLLNEYRTIQNHLKRFKVNQLIVCSGNHDFRTTGFLLFNRCFPFRQITEIEDKVFLVLSTARPDRDEGEAGHRQNVWLKQELSKHKDQYKVVLMHHHLIPIPDTGPDRLTIIDSGDILRTLIRGNIDLVLCGHRHRPWKWDLKGFSVIHAGTLSSERLRGFFANSYNILKIEKKGVEAQLKIVGGQKIDFTKILEEEAPPFFEIDNV